MEKLPFDKLIPCAVVLLIALTLWILLKKFRDFNAKRSGNTQKRTIFRVLYGIFRFLIVLFAILEILTICGVNVTSAVAGLGIASAIVGLALQDLLKDVIMGTHIMTDSFFSIGDGVSFQGEEGIVTEFTLQTTKIRLLRDNSILSVCNRDIDQILKLSDCMDVDFSLSCEDEPEKVGQVFAEICAKLAEEPGAESCEFLGLQELADFSMVYRVRLHCCPEYRPSLRRSALRIARRQIAAAGLTIPYPQMELHLSK